MERKTSKLLLLGFVISVVASLVCISGNAANPPTADDLLGHPSQRMILGIPRRGDRLSLVDYDVAKMGESGMKLVVAPRCTSCSVNAFSPNMLRGSRDVPVLVFYADEDDPRLRQTERATDFVFVSKSTLVEHIPYSLFEAAPSTVFLDKDCRIIEVSIE